MQVTFPKTTSFLRGIRANNAPEAFPNIIWTCPNYDTSAKIGVIKYKYIPLRHLNIIQVEPLWLQKMLFNCYDNKELLKMDTIGFCNFSNQEQETRVLQYLSLVAKRYKIDGIYRNIGDGPVIVFFRDCVIDSVQIETLL